MGCDHNNGDKRSSWALYVPENNWCVETSSTWCVETSSCVSGGKGVAHSTHLSVNARMLCSEYFSCSQSASSYLVMLAEGGCHVRLNSWREVGTFAWTAEGRLARSLEQLKGGWHVRLNSWREVGTFTRTALSLDVETQCHDTVMQGPRK